jgi:hypothetical protein
LEFEPVKEDLHGENFNRAHTPPARRTPVRELKIMDRTDEVPARELMSWKLILSECKQALVRFQNYNAWKRDLAMAAMESTAQLLELGKTEQTGHSSRGDNEWSLSAGGLECAEICGLAVTPPT